MPRYKNNITASLNKKTNVNMKNEERQRIIEILESGEMLSSEWAPIVFPKQRRECELVYHGKAREEDILLETMSVPLQQNRLFGSNGNDWHNKLIFGDNLQVMKSLLEDKEKGKLRNSDKTKGIRLVYIDPPFTTQKEMKNQSGAPAYLDKLAVGEFLEFLRKRLILIRELLSDDGSVYVHLDWRMNSYVKVLMDEVFGKNKFQREIIWDIRVLSGYKTIANNWIRGHEMVLFYSKQDKFLFKKPYQPHTKEYLAEFNKEDEGGKYMIAHKKKRYLKDVISKGKPFGDVWDDIKSFQQQPTSAEKIDYPTQKPETLLERIIKASSDEGDLVADFFLGSGTTIAVAEKLGRRWIGSDCGKLAIYTTQKRMLNLREKIGNKGKPLQPKPFAMYNAGLYELDKLAKAPSTNWRRFVLQLFQCREEKHKIGGIQMDGKFRGKSVLVYNPYDLNKEEQITEETIQELHSIIGKMVGGQMFLIAPAQSFGFFQDYVDLDNTRYYALRIPYSIINELHRRDFTTLRQPDNKTAVNNTVDAVGFDFNCIPKLDYSVGMKKKKGDSYDSAFIKIETFESKASIPDTLRINGNRKTISMLMLDYDYDPDKGVFEFDEVFYADDLDKEYWTAYFPVDKLGNNVMAIFIDIYGNEARELVNVSSFKNMENAIKVNKTKQ